MRRPLAILAAIACLTGCGRLAPKTFDDSARPVTVTVAAAEPRTKVETPKASRPAAALTPKQRAAFRRWIVGYWYRRWLAGLAALEHYNWDAVARCETGGRWNMTGSVYSTGLGMMNQAIRENASPASAARQLAGVASRAEIVATAERIAARHGIDSWGCSAVA